MKTLKLCFYILLLGTSALDIRMAHAQDYPVKPIRLIVPYAPGGSNDTVARIIAVRLGKPLGQQVVVENRSGADGRLGTELGAKAAPDGYTILMVSTFHSTAPSVVAKLPYDPVKDFVPIAMTSIAPNLLVVHPAVPARTVAEFIKLAKSKPGRINCSTSGWAQTPHINLEMLKLAAGLDITAVPYKGGAEAAAALLGGHVDMAFTSIVEAAPHVRVGKLRALAITSAQHSLLMPEVSTMVESGFPGFVNVTWQGVVAPAGTPKQFAAKLSSEIGDILKTPEVRDLMLRTGYEPNPTTPEEFGEFIRTEIVRLGKVVKAAGMRPE